MSQDDLRRGAIAVIAAQSTLDHVDCGATRVRPRPTHPAAAPA
jgi:hypothetical protein